VDGSPIIITTMAEKLMKKDILFLGTIIVKNDSATFSLLRLVFRYSGYVNVKCSSIYLGLKDIVHPCRCGSTLSNN
jgi:hypothetical protein